MSDVCADTPTITQPLRTFLHTLSCMRCLPVSLATGGPGLPAGWGEARAVEMLREAGFAGVRVERLPDDRINHYFIATLTP